MTDTRFILDSNILVYAFDSSDARKHDIAEQLLTEILETESIICVQNLAEFYNTITLKMGNPITIKEAYDIIKLIIDCKNVTKLHYGGKTLLAAIELSTKVHFWDAILIATMLENQVYTIYTENVKDFKDSRIKAINPFKR
ncbi:PIN domain-containing protein [Candidatus Woesearchaeota archaeon]|nr:PIN domain-containing protein [Candidatus Woesearchaeota archaeon]